LYLFGCINSHQDASGKVSELRVALQRPSECAQKPRAFIHWVANPLPCSVRLYNKLWATICYLCCMQQNKEELPNLCSCSPACSVWSPIPRPNCEWGYLVLSLIPRLDWEWDYSGTESHSWATHNFRFFHKNPEDTHEVPGGFLSDVNPVSNCLFNIAVSYYVSLREKVYSFLQNSLLVLENVLVDRSIVNAPPLTRFQFERLGYFCVDLDSTEEKVSVLCQRRVVLDNRSLEISKHMTVLMGEANAEATCLISKGHGCPYLANG